MRRYIEGVILSVFTVFRISFRLFGLRTNTYVNCVNLIYCMFISSMKILHSTNMEGIEFEFTDEYVLKFVGQVSTKFFHYRSLLLIVTIVLLHLLE